MQLNIKQMFCYRNIGSLCFVFDYQDPALGFLSSLPHPNLQTPAHRDGQIRKW